MSRFTSNAEKIPGLLWAAWIFKGTTHDGRTASLAWLKDGQSTALVDVSEGLMSDAALLSAPMQSYLSGLAEVGSYLKNRKTVDEDGVSADDVERAALMLAFPKVGQNKAALDVLKKHLDMLQKHGLVEKLAAQPNVAAAAAKPAAPAPKAPPQPEPSQQKPAQEAPRARAPEPPQPKAEDDASKARARDAAAAAATAAAATQRDAAKADTKDAVKQEQPVTDAKAKAERSGSAEALILGAQDAAADAASKTPTEDEKKKRRRLLF